MGAAREAIQKGDTTARPRAATRVATEATRGAKEVATKATGKSHGNTPSTTTDGARNDVINAQNHGVRNGARSDARNDVMNVVAKAEAIVVTYETNGRLVPPEIVARSSQGHPKGGLRCHHQLLVHTRRRGTGLGPLFNRGRRGLPSWA